MEEAYLNPYRRCAIYVIGVLKHLFTSYLRKNYHLSWFLLREMLIKG